MHPSVVALVVFIRLLHLQAPPASPTLASFSPQAYLTLVLPAILAFLGTTFSGWIRQDGFNVWINRFLTAIAILIAAVLSVYVNGQLTGNFSADYASIQAAIALLMGGILAPLGQEFQSNWFAFLPAKTNASSLPHPAQLPAVKASGLSAQNTAPTGVIPAQPQTRTTNAAQGWQAGIQDWTIPQGGKDTSG